MAPYDGKMLLQAMLTLADSMDTVFPQGKFLDQADINKALFAALKKMHSEVLKTSASNQSLYDYVGTLKARIMALEQDNTQLRAMLDGRGIKQPPPKLSLAISKLDLDEHPSGGLPTPSTVRLRLLLMTLPILNIYIGRSVRHHAGFP